MCDDFKERMSKLTPRERQVCEVIQQQPGLTVNGISRQVGVSRSTVKWHLSKVYDKLQVNSRPELVANLCKGSNGNA